jgi:hypothetical protein
VGAILCGGDGRELFFLGPDGTMMSVPIGDGPSLDAGPPRALFHPNVWAVVRNQVYAVTRDARFLVTVTPQKTGSVAPLTVVLNWTAATHR